MEKLKKKDKLMSDRQRAAAIKAVHKGASPRKVAAKYNVSVQHIYFICKPEEERHEIIRRRLEMHKLKE